MGALLIGLRQQLTTGGGAGFEIPKEVATRAVGSSKLEEEDVIKAVNIL